MPVNGVVWERGHRTLKWTRENGMREEKRRENGRWWRMCAAAAGWLCTPISLSLS